MIRNFASASFRSTSALGVAVLACLCVGCLQPAGASADTGTKIIERCAHGESLAGYTVQQYQQAIKDLTTEALEYSDCAEEIQKAEMAAAAHKGGTGTGAQSPGGGSAGNGGGGGSSPGSGPSTAAAPPVEPTPAQQKVLERTRAAGVPPVHLGDGGGSVLPGVVHANLASAASNLPVPVLAVIAAVLAGMALLAGKEIHARIQRARG